MNTIQPTRSACHIGVAVWELDARGRGAIARASELGLANVHVDLADLTWEGESIDEDELKDLCTKAGVAIVALGVNQLNALGLREEMGASRRAIELAVERALALRVPMVHLPSFREAAIRTEDDMRLAAAALRYACDVAGRRVVIATENAVPADACAQLLDAVGRAEVTVLFDCLNPVFEGQEPLEILTRFAGRLAPVVHVKDGTPGRKGNARIGRGVGRIADSLAQLACLRWAGSLVLENDYTVDAASRMAEDVAALHRLTASLRMPELD